MDFLTNQFNAGSAWLLVATVLIVGVLHTIVPDHWVPITLIARQRGWSKKETARVALQAGTGHVVTTLILAAIVWVAGVAVAAKFGHVIDSISSVALVTFGVWMLLARGVRFTLTKGMVTVTIFHTWTTGKATPSRIWVFMDRNCNRYRSKAANCGCRSMSSVNRRTFA